MTDTNTLLTGKEREEYIAKRFADLTKDTPLSEEERDEPILEELSPEFKKAREDFAAWYDNKTEEEQELIDIISDTTTHIIDEDEYDEFVDELNGWGITTASEYEDVFDGEWEGTGERVTTLFAEEYLEGCGYSIEPEFLYNCIDWELVWYSALRYDYATIEFKGNTYFLRSV